MAGRTGTMACQRKPALPAAQRQVCGAKAPSPLPPTQNCFAPAKHSL